MNSFRLCLSVALCAALGLACGPRASAPRKALDAYADALRDGDYGRAYELMGEEFRAKHSRDDFVRMLKENPGEVKETVRRLEDGGGDLDVEAEFRYGLGDRMRLVQEDGEWRIASNPVAFYGQDTPRESLRSFLRAYKLKRWEVMLRFVPKSYREKMTVETMRKQFEGPRREEIQTMMNILEANLDEPISDTKSNEARMPYGEKYEVKFVREDGLWKIQDLD